jgi:hypothetical protein
MEVSSRAILLRDDLLDYACCLAELPEISSVGCWSWTARLSRWP